MVFVLDKKGKPLMPCTEKRARLLLERGRARVHRVQPFVIRLVDRTQEESILQPLRLKIDPGSKTTGMALVLEQECPKVVSLVEVEHKQGISDAIAERRGFRRFRRNRYRRYRARRFKNRPRTKCYVCGQNARLGRSTCRVHAHNHREGQEKGNRWLAPSLNSRVLAQEAWVKRFMQWAPVTALSLENVKFDTQKMQNPEIQGIEYQQGTLQGYEVREYMLERDGRKCWWCEATGVPLNIDHVVPKDRGGSDRITNLVLSCRSCNEAHGNKLLPEWAEQLRSRKDRLSKKRLENITSVA